MCDLTCDVTSCCVEAVIWVKSMYMIKSCLETRKKINEDVEIKEILTRISIQNIISEWNSQFPKASWCQMERWHHLPYLMHIVVCGSGIVI